MPSSFKHILISGRQRAGTDGFVSTLQTLLGFLTDLGISVSIESETLAAIPNGAIAHFPAPITTPPDLMVVIGGDGSLLHAAHTALEFAIPVIGINRGRLGFLTDIAPNDISAQLEPVLNGEYHEESRFLLAAKLEDGTTQIALNDIVLLPSNAAHMIEFNIEINNELVCHQRSDGLIIATPTGSTAYALSGGGPIIHPSLDAIVLVPMFPHTLSSRPIVVDANSVIKITIASFMETNQSISCDGSKYLPIPADQSFSIEKHTKTLRLIHPKSYNYYETLRSKLKWQSK